MSYGKKPTILILGADGMLGRTVFFYLKKHFPNTTWGTVKNIKNKNTFLFSFDAYDYKKLSLISKEIKRIDYLINCIAVLKNFSDFQDLTYINSLFPRRLEELSEQLGSSLIHVSTDAVFSPLEKIVFENSQTNPEDEYGKSKLLGETATKNALTFRISVLGFDPINKKGVIERLLKNNQQAIIGYTNQQWSGCTTLQFSMFCKNIIAKNMFQKMRNTSPLFHFAPIRHTTKFLLSKSVIEILKLKTKLKPGKGEKITRFLDTLYPDLLSLDNYKSDIKEALLELTDFEQTRYIK